MTERPCPAPLEILSPDGQVFATGLSPESFCGGLRQVLENAADANECVKWWDGNASQIARLRALAPQLKTQRGEHYADVLARLFEGDGLRPRRQRSRLRQRPPIPPRSFPRPAGAFPYCAGPPHRQGRTEHWNRAPYEGQDTHQLRRVPAMPRVRGHAGTCPSSDVRAVTWPFA